MSLTSHPRADAAGSTPDRGAVMAVVQGGLTDPRPPRPGAADPAASRYLAAFDLLDGASLALETLAERRDALEAALRDVSARAEAAVAGSAARAAEWQEVAADLKARHEALAAEAAGLRERAARAEAERDAARLRAEEAERRTAELQRLLRGLHGKVMSAFGQGTRVHGILADLAEAPPALRSAAR